MAKVINNFLKGKMNKDLDDRLIPNGEYRNAVNTQISKSEGQNVGALENTLGNILSFDFRQLCNNDNLFSIGYCTDEINNRVFLFLTDNTGNDYKVSPGADKSSFIVMYDAVSSVGSILVEGDFLNFSTLFPITGVNILEELLFFTDNRNQPRKINVSLALVNGVTYYTTEDQISVAKYNPHETIELYRIASDISASNTNYETTLYDVASKYYPDGGLGLLPAAYNYPNGTNIRINKSNYEGDLIIGATVAYILNGVFYKTTSTVSNVTDGGAYFNVTLSSALGQTLAVADNPKIIFQYNDYYEIDYNGDSDFLHDKFVRFGYRFKFIDGEYSIMSPFTQDCFIPKQDGYFMYKVNDSSLSSYKSNSPILDIQDEEDTYRTTTVEFMENKVNKILLRIPLPYNSTQMQSILKVEEIDILYKESDTNNINVIDSVSISTIQNQTGTAQVNGTPAATTSIPVDTVTGGIRVGALVTGTGIVNSPTVVSFDGTTVILSNAQTLANNTVLTFGDPNVFEYEYQSTKPIKTLPSSETTRTYDVVPVKALGQEVISNRVVYANFQNKHNPPSTINYNVAVSEKTEFNIGTGGALVNGATGATADNFSIDTITGVINNGMTVTANNPGVPAGTVVVSYIGSTLTISNNLTQSLPDNTVLTFSNSNPTSYTTSSVEYPNSSLKQNRNYQVGVVLSDRYGRQSTVVLSSTDNSVSFNNKNYLGSTVFTPYIDSDVNARTFLGNSLKVLFNDPISGSTTGLYNDDTTSTDYNPTGWYSYKIVVKQTEQDYYNVYLPGVMAAYPENINKELGKTSHAVLINDNINKVPRDLTEVGPEQKLFRSSVILHGRVENLNSSTVDVNNKQHYPGLLSPIVSAIATDDDLFNGVNNINYSASTEFYNVDSDPLIARINTPSGQFGIQAVLVTIEADGANLTATTFGVDTTTVSPGSVPSNVIVAGQKISGEGIPEGCTVVNVVGSVVNINNPSGVICTPSNGDVITFSPTPFRNANSTSLTIPRLVNMPQLAVMETDPVDSNLDIFWETTSTGLISQLNTAILGGINDSVSISGFNFAATFLESLGNNSNILTSNFTIVDQFGNNVAYAATVPPQIELESVLDYNEPPNDVTSSFALVDPGTGQYNVKTQDFLYYSNQNATSQTYLFNFKINHPTGVETIVSQGPVSLQNVNPTIVSCVNPATYVPGTSGGGSGTFHTLNAKNGSNGLGGNTFKDLTWSITVTKSGVDYGPSGTGDVQIDQGINVSNWRGRFYFQGGNPPVSMVDGTYVCVATVQDAGGAIATCPFNLVIDRTFCYTFLYNSSNDGANLGSFVYTDCLGDATASTGPIINNGSIYTICARSMSAAAITAGFVQQPITQTLCNGS
tara:strand:- start:3682 stop:7782 length:4101 start_codon:yes stop_codon:yes gene_type:complete